MTFNPGVAADKELDAVFEEAALEIKERLGLDAVFIIGTRSCEESEVTETSFRHIGNWNAIYGMVKIWELQRTNHSRKNFGANTEEEKT